MLVTPELWKGRRVLVTGHTGFKGAWLSLWLDEMGADVTGIALAPPTDPSIFELAHLDRTLDHKELDIRNPSAVRDAVAHCDPEVVFHLAAQPLVRESYDCPAETWATNVMGTMHLLDACRDRTSLKAIVCVTSDKCYENREWVWPYRESDPMGGHDPYSSSKGAAELAVASMRKSFFGHEDAAGVCSVRAGNVIGGGDWAKDRLVPDIIAALQRGEPPLIRSPDSIRPWQHVLEALHGYLLIAERLVSGDRTAATAWNFGPEDAYTQPVRWIADRLVDAWGGNIGWTDAAQTGHHEAKILKLDCSKARSELGWRPRLALAEALEYIVAWHKAVGNGANARDVTLSQIRAFTGTSSPLRQAAE